MAAIDEHDFFIAYEGSEARALADELATELARRDMRAFIDRELAPGEPWPERLPKAIDSASVFVAVVAADERDAPYFRSEVAQAIESWKERRRPTIVPIRLGERIPFGLDGFESLDSAAGVPSLASKLEGLAREDSASGIELFASRDEATPRMLADFQRARRACFFGVSHSKLGSYLAAAVRLSKGSLPLEHVDVHFASREIGELLEPHEFDANVARAILDVAQKLKLDARSFRRSPTIAFYRMRYVLSPSGSRFLLEGDRVPDDLPFSVIYHVSVERGRDLTDAWTLLLRYESCNANERRVFHRAVGSFRELESKRVLLFEAQGRNPWDRSGKAWDEFQRDHGVYDEITSHIWRVAGIQPSHRVLDLGSGTGRSLKKQIETLEGGSIVLVDASPGMLSVASETYHNDRRVRIALADARNPLPAAPEEGRFDRITSCLALQTFVRGGLPLHEFAIRCKKLLAPGGVAVVAAHNSVIACDRPEGYASWRDPLRPALERALEARGHTLLRSEATPELLEADQVREAFRGADLACDVTTVVVERAMVDRLAMWRTPAVLDSIADVDRMSDDDIAQVIHAAGEGLAGRETLPTTVKLFRLERR